MSDPAPIAFYDFDGTLVASNIVTRYSFLVRQIPSRALSIWKLLKLISSVPAYLLLDRASRRLFNEVFFKEYRGLRKEWLDAQAQTLFEQAILPSVFAGAKEMVEADRAQGSRVVLVTGELDFALGPVVSYFGFDDLIANNLIFQDGAATGAVTPPLIAETAKVKAMISLCRRYHVDIRHSKAYSDSFSDVPMLEAVGYPCAVNPDLRLRRKAERCGWPIRDLVRSGVSPARVERGHHAHLS